MLSRLIHISYSAQLVTDNKNMTSTKEFCHILLENGGVISSNCLDANLCRYVETTEYTEPMVSVEFSFSGLTKGATIYIPKGQTLL
jgi:hypothetical protein